MARIKHVRQHRPEKGYINSKMVSESVLEAMLGCVSPAQESQIDVQQKKGVYSEVQEEVRRHIDAGKRAIEAQNKKVKEMTVSLYKSAATGKIEVVVQTNAQSLDLFIVGLADATNAVMQASTDDERHHLLESIFKNAFPLAFAISGYKADKVVETRMLVCGALSADSASLLAHSKV